jgi:hypothetical protein
MTVSRSGSGGLEGAHALNIDSAQSSNASNRQCFIVIVGLDSLFVVGI